MDNASSVLHSTVIHSLFYFKYSTTPLKRIAFWVVSHITRHLYKVLEIINLKEKNKFQKKICQLL